MKVIAVATGIAVLLSAKPAHAAEDLSVKNLHSAKIGDAAFRYKAAACAVMDHYIAGGLNKVDKDGTRKRSSFFSNETIDSYDNAFAVLYGGGDREKAAAIISHPVIDQYVNFIMFEDRRNVEVNVPACRDAMKDVWFKWYNNREAFSAKPAKSKPISRTKEDAHKECLEAKDYEGCIRVRSQKTSTKHAEDCEPGKWCKAPGGKDMLGMEQIKGWWMKSIPTEQTVIYNRPGAQKVMVRGAADRYIGTDSVIRYYESPRAGVAPTSTTIGTRTTNCYSYTSSIECTTTPPLTLRSPGTAARPGGVRQISRVSILDCKEKTVATHNDYVIEGKWESIAGTPWVKTYEKYCPIIETLELSDFTKYASR